MANFIRDKYTPYRKEKIYIMGDMLKKGNQLLRNQESKAILDLGYHIYSPLCDKEINDKQAQTVETNNKLAERIVTKDMEAILESDIIVADVDNDNVGTSVEIGAVMQHNWWYDKLYEALHDEKGLDKIKSLLDKYPKKKVYCHCSDIRHTDIPEVGMRRSYSINQFLHGACLRISDGITVFDDVIKQLEEQK